MKLDSRWAVVLLPTLALLTWGVALQFVEHLDIYLLSARWFELPAIYATEMLLLAPVVAVLALGGLSAYGLIRAVPRLEPLVALGAAAAFWFIFLFLGLHLAKTWLLTFGVQAPGGATFAAAGGAVVIALLRDRSKAVGRIHRDLVQTSWLLLLAGVVCLPLLMLTEIIARAEPPTRKITAETKPDIVLLSLDALNAQNMSLYGHARPTTPNLESFAARATVFDRFYAGSNFTTSGVSVMLTGEPLSRTRALQLRTWPLAETRANSIPALLHAAGYETAYVSSNPYGGGARNLFGSYFDVAISDRVNGIQGVCRDSLVKYLSYACLSTNLISQNAFNVPLGRDDALHLHEPRLVSEPARRLMSQSRGKPRFLWLHFTPPHDPYAAPPPWLGRFAAGPGARSVTDSIPAYGPNVALQTPERTRLLEGRYDESIAFIDDHLGRVLAEVEAKMPNAMVIITSDHGESFDYGFGGHGGDALYENVIRIPMIVRMPGQASAQRIETPFGHADLKGLVVAVLAGAGEADLQRIADDARRKGPVLAMNFQDNPRLEPLRRGAIAAIEGPFKYVRVMDGSKSSSRLVRVDQREDGPDLGPLHPDVARRLAKAVDDHLAVSGGRVRRPF